MDSCCCGDIESYSVIVPGQYYRRPIYTAAVRFFSRHDSSDNYRAINYASRSTRVGSVGRMCRVRIALYYTAFELCDTYIIRIQDEEETRSEREGNEKKNK